jgi:fatty acid desaturase
LAEYWRARARNFAIAGVVCAALAVLLKAADAAIGVLAVPLVLFVLLFAAGLYCGYRHWRALRDYEVASGGSAKTAQEKWHKMYPPSAG